MEFNFRVIVCLMKIVNKYKNGTWYKLKLTEIDEDIMISIENFGNSCV